MSYKMLVGTFTVKAAREVTEHYECAAWHKTILVQPGVCPVFAYVAWIDGQIGHTLSAPVTGKVTSACFVARLGGSYGRDDGPSMIGKEDTGSIDLPTYCLDRIIASGELKLDMDLITARPCEGGGNYYGMAKDVGIARINKIAALPWQKNEAGESVLVGKKLVCKVRGGFPSLRWSIERDGAEVHSWIMNNASDESAKCNAYETARGMMIAECAPCL